MTENRFDRRGALAAASILTALPDGKSQHSVKEKESNRM